MPGLRRLIAGAVLGVAPLSTGAVGAGVLGAGSGAAPSSSTSTPWARTSAENPSVQPADTLRSFHWSARRYTSTSTTARSVLTGDRDFQPVGIDGDLQALGRQRRRVGVVL